MGSALTIAFPADAEAAQQEMMDQWTGFMHSVCAGDFAGATADGLLFLDAMSVYLSQTTGQPLPASSMTIALPHIVDRAMSKKEEFDTSNVPSE